MFLKTNKNEKSLSRYLKIYVKLSNLFVFYTFLNYVLVLLMNVINDTKKSTKHCNTVKIKVKVFKVFMQI